MNRTTLVLSFGLIANLASLMTFAAVLPQVASALHLDDGEAGSSREAAVPAERQEEA